MTISTLENISLAELTAVFNLSFSDYVVPFHLTSEQLENKMNSENARLDLSVGAFDNDKLVGFILHCEDVVNGEKVVYNAGTGVIPANRGQKLTSRMYEFILPYLVKQNIRSLQLEVITTNKPAIKTYENIGFRISRKLHCYKGNVKPVDQDQKQEIRTLKLDEWEKMTSFWDISPTWQNFISVLERLKNSNVSIGIFEANKLLAYLVYNPKSKRIQQIATDPKHRKKGLATQLLQYISVHHGPEMFIINVDAGSESATGFLENAGFENYIAQYEMELILPAGNSQGK